MKVNQRRMAWLIPWAVVSLMAANAAATDFPITWTFGGSYSDLNIDQNDTVTWTYSASHNVHEFPDEAAFNSCDFTMATLVGDFSASPLTLDFAGGGTRYFGCAVAGHCSAGNMKIKVITAPNGLIFEDGFESGIPDAWSTVVP